MFLILKNKVFKADLKDEREPAVLRKSGRVFHNVGAHKENVCLRLLSRVKRDLEDEWRLRGVWSSVTRTKNSEAFANAPYGPDGIVCFSTRLVYVVCQCY